MKKILTILPASLLVASIAHASPQAATQGKVKLKFTNDTQSVLTIDNAKYENILENDKFDTASISSETNFDFSQDIDGQEPTQLSFVVRDNNDGHCNVVVAVKNADWLASKECSGDLKNSTVRVTNPTLSKALVELDITSNQ